MPWISRKRAMYEAATNTAINFLVTPSIWYFFLVPVLHIDLPADTSAYVVLTFILLSTLRMYAVRRYFHRIHKQ